MAKRRGKQMGINKLIIMMSLGFLFMYNAAQVGLHMAALTAGMPSTLNFSWESASGFIAMVILILIVVNVVRFFIYLANGIDSSEDTSDEKDEDLWYCAECDTEYDNETDATTCDCQYEKENSKTKQVPKTPAFKNTTTYTISEDSEKPVKEGF